MTKNELRPSQIFRKGDHAIVLDGLSRIPTGITQYYRYGEAKDIYFESLISQIQPEPISEYWAKQLGFSKLEKEHTEAEPNMYSLGDLRLVFTEDHNAVLFHEQPIEKMYNECCATIGIQWVHKLQDAVLLFTGKIV